MKKFASMMVVAMVVVGCGGDVSEDDARSGWAKTNAVLSSGGMAAQSSAGDTAQDPSYRALPVGTSVDYQYACSGGGTLHFVGTYEVATGLGTDVNFTYDATFAGCDAGGVTVDGQLDYAASVSTSDTGTSITYDYKGDLTWSGDVEGGCVIDMQGSVTTTTGGVGPGSVSISYKGSICGYDAAATLNVNG
ncbi:MAG TPA: hypothetical protein PKW35_08415 [Nannocystaceae bacterium]|nr:hypothetical protein [Nannocystaceae bacterium]